METVQVVIVKQEDSVHGREVFQLAIATVAIHLIAMQEHVEQQPRPQQQRQQQLAMPAQVWEADYYVIPKPA